MNQGPIHLLISDNILFFDFMGKTFGEKKIKNSPTIYNECLPLLQ